MEHNHFRQLSTASDFQAIGEAVRDCFEVLRGRYSAAKICGLIFDYSDGALDINENTLKSWLDRSHTSRTNKSTTLEQLYNFLMEYERKFPQDLRAEMAGSFDKLNPGFNSSVERRKSFEDTMEHVFGGLLLNWTGVSPESLRKYQQELSAEYFMFRRSVRSPEHIVRSEVSIQQVRLKDLKVSHTHYDRNEEKRRSSGFMVPAEFNHFAVMNVENGASIEFLALKKSVTEHYKRLIGFIITINSDGVLVCARTVLLKKAHLDIDPPIRFHESRYAENKTMAKTLSYLDEDKAMTIPDRTQYLYAEEGEDVFAEG